MRKETGVEHIARDIREGRFPRTSEPKMVAEASADDLRKIAAGLLADGLDVDKLTPIGRTELRTAIDIIIRLAGD